MPTTFSLQKGIERAAAIGRIAAFLTALSRSHAWTVEVKQFNRRRSDPQNRYLWGVAYPSIVKHLEGWTAEDVHEYCLGECFGWERIEGLNRARLKPVKRSSKLSVTEFADFVAFIQRRMAEHGVYVPDPNESAEEAA
jgi:hypothetical protein